MIAVRTAHRRQCRSERAGGGVGRIHDALLERRLAGRRRTDATCDLVVEEAGLADPTPGVIPFGEADDAAAGVPGSVHITSNDGNPPINYLFQVTPDCVPEVITTIPSTIPDTTIPATTIPDSTIPATTVPATTIPAPTTTAAAVLAPTALPATGSSSPTLGVLAFGLLGIGILMLRFTRRVS